VVNEASFGIIPLQQVEGGGWKVFLILHKEGNHWGFPKGKAEEGEIPSQSAARELLEETRLEVKKFLLDHPIQECYTFYRKKTKVHKTVTYFPALVTGAFVLQPEEIRDGKWMPLEEAEQQLTFVEARRICHKLKKELQP
jgi:bis(5'-nucleosidyl)-tetraphosphatase